MLDQVRIGDKYSYDDYEASMKSREVSQPEKKSIKDTVAFSNQIYDFSTINGEIYWEERALEYVFEITADTPEELEDKKRDFLAWIMFIHEANLYDPFIVDYHFIATYDSIDVDDTEIEKSTIKVKFTAYPYLISNAETTYTIAIPTGETRTSIIVNDSAHKVIPTLSTTAAINIKMGNTSYSLSSGITSDEQFELDPGSSTLTITNSGTENCVLTISFYAEVI